jgi:hypothetical protein
MKRRDYLARSCPTPQGIVLATPEAVSNLRHCRATPPCTLTGKP